MQSKRGRPRKLDPIKGLETALILFQKYGFDNVSIAELCSQLSIPPTSLYAAYGNKKALFLRALAIYKQRFFDTLEDAISKSKNPSEMFRDTLETSLSFYLNENQKSGCLILQGSIYCKQPQVAQELNSCQIELTRKVKNRLSTLQSQSAQEIADVLVTLMRGLSLSVQNSTDEDQLYTSLEVFCTAFDC